ncbi:colanic acid biosynthesis glycosyltransferase WcaL [Chromatiales bacterium (ex Bugula neritina AB1)]|nr:colanic acid biosynthesis glycosyltransferase WcaL [Chromatiales bacterium (ex Bugula neritina AB1)]
MTRQTFNPAAAPDPDLVIVVKCWPRLSETFVAQELAALEARGQQFQIWSLRHPVNEKRHPLHEQVTAAIRYLPEYLHQEPSRVFRSWRRCKRLSGYKQAMRVFLADLRRDFTRNRLRRFGQACVLAAELPGSIQALYAHFLHTPASVARYAAIMQGLPWSFSAHAKDIWTAPEWELREKLDRSSFGASFGVTCTAIGARYLRELSPEAERIDLVYHGLDLSRFPAPPERSTSATQKLAGNQHKVIRLLSVGRLVEKKGYDRLIAALARLPDRIEWHLTHIGGGDLNVFLQDQATVAGVADKIDWQGEQEQPAVIKAMREADLFILPSRIAANGDRDGLPNVLMEAASQKLPIIATSVSAIPEFLQNGVHALLAEDSADALAVAIAEMADNPAQRAAMAEAAYQRLVDDFGMEAGITVLDQRLRSICGRVV